MLTSTPIPEARAQGIEADEATALIQVHTLTDGGQTSPEVAQKIAAFVDGARETLELALYDIRLEDGTGDISYDPDRRRWYVDASGKLPRQTVPSLLKLLLLNLRATVCWRWTSMPGTWRQSSSTPPAIRWARP